MSAVMCGSACSQGLLLCTMHKARVTGWPCNQCYKGGLADTQKVGQRTSPQAHGPAFSLFAQQHSIVAVDGT